jgi:hypothetical protein
MKSAEHSKEAAESMGYAGDGRKPRAKIQKGKQRMLLNSTKLLLDNVRDEDNNPYEPVQRIHTNVYQMFGND